MKHPDDAPQERPRCDECHTAVAPLIAYLDGECALEDARQIERRVAQCPGCARILATHSLVGERLDALHAATAPRIQEGWSDRVRERAEKQARRHRRRWIATCGALGAAASILLLVRFITSPTPGPVPTSPVVSEAEVISDLDILEIFVEAGVEPTTELVDALLGTEERSEERADDEPEWESDVLDLLIDEGLPSRKL